MPFKNKYLFKIGTLEKEEKQPLPVSEQALLKASEHLSV